MIQTLEVMAMGRWLTLAVRVVFGGMFVMSGAMKVLPLEGPPPDLPPEALAFVGALAGTGYFLPSLGAIEVISGLAIVTGVFVPLALVILAPVVIHVALFHTLLAPAAGIVIFLLAAEVYLTWTCRAAFAPLLTPRYEAPVATAMNSVRPPGLAA